MVTQTSEAGESYRWVAGATLAAFASVISNLGLNLQKLTHLQIQGESEEAKKQYFTKKLWMSGLFLIILGSVADFVALGFAAQSIVAPLGSLTLVSNVFFAQFLLNESICLRDILATAAIIGGSSLAVAFASHADHSYTAEELFGFYYNPRFAFYAFVVIGFMALLWFAIQYMEQAHTAYGRAGPYLALERYHRFAYAALSGTVGAQSVLFAKCSAELIVNMFEGRGVLFAHPESYIVITAMCVTIFLQIKWLNAGLRRFDALYIVPVFQTFWILVSVVSGLIFFGEYAEMDETQVLVFPVGILLTIAGVYVLSQRGVSEHEQPPAATDAAHAHASPGTTPVRDTLPLLKINGRSSFDEDEADGHAHIDPTIGFVGHGPPAAFTPSMMGRSSAVFQYRKRSRDTPLSPLPSSRQQSGSKLTEEAASGAASTPVASISGSGTGLISRAHTRSSPLTVMSPSSHLRLNGAAIINVDDNGSGAGARVSQRSEEFGTVTDEELVPLSSQRV